MKGCDLEVISSRWLAYNQIDDPMTVTGIEHPTRGENMRRKIRKNICTFRMVTNGYIVDNAD